MQFHEFQDQHIVIRNLVQQDEYWAVVFCEICAYGVAHTNVCGDLGFDASEVGAEHDISAEVRRGEREPVSFLARLHRWHIMRQH